MRGGDGKEDSGRGERRGRKSLDLAAAMVGLGPGAGATEKEKEGSKESRGGLGLKFLRRPSRG